MTNLQHLQAEYYQILQQQNIVPSDLDYSIFEQQVPFLNQMAKVKNSGISVFDLYNHQCEWL